MCRFLYGDMCCTEYPGVFNGRSVPQAPSVMYSLTDTASTRPDGQAGKRVHHVGLHWSHYWSCTCSQGARDGVAINKQTPRVTRAPRGRSSIHSWTSCCSRLINSKRPHRCCHLLNNCSSRRMLSIVCNEPGDAPWKLSYPLEFLAVPSPTNAWFLGPYVSTP